MAELGEVAASGGYVAAIAADHIVGRGNTLTGSIGVIMEYPDLTQVMAQARHRPRDGALLRAQGRAVAVPARPTRRHAPVDEALVAESYRWFRGLVGERRGLEGARLDAVANGGVFTGRLALENGLIDEIGGEPQALAWLESRDGALAGLPVRDWEVERDGPLAGRFLGKIASSGGILGEISLQTAPKLYSIGP